jgi:peptidoglycan-N-acetylglucosamine deacetylase
VSGGPHSGDPNGSASLAHLVVVGFLLLFAVIAAAGCESVQAQTRRRSRPMLPIIGVRGESAAPGTASPDRAPIDGIPTFAPVPPHTPLPAFNRAPYLGRPVTFVPNDKREVALTFDDGPSKNTHTILRILREHRAHATFFLVGERAQYNNEAVLAAVVQGQEIADHTWSHRALRRIDATTAATQIDRSQAVLAAESGSTPAFVRPRGGKFDEAGRKALAERGIVMALWSVHANDVLDSPPPEVLVDNVVSAAKPGSIILMHETNHNTVVALPKILAELRAKGLHPVTLSQLLADGHP